MTLSIVVLVMETTGAMQLIVPIMLVIFVSKCSNSSTRTSYISPAFHQLFSRVSTFESPALTPDLAFRTINTGM